LKLEKCFKKSPGDLEPQFRGMKWIAHAAKVNWNAPLQELADETSWLKPVFAKGSIENPLQGLGVRR